MKKKITPTNRNAVIRSRDDRTGKHRTETHRRDEDSTKFAISTDPKTNTTNLFIDFAPGEYLRLTGAEARTLYRLLSKHYCFTNKAI